MSTKENLKAQCFLVKTKNNSFHIIKWDQLIMHRGKNKVKLGVEISWSGKNRDERGSGTIVAIGCEEHCEATRKNIEDSSSAVKSSSSSRQVCLQKSASKITTNGRNSNTTAKPSSKNTSSTVISSPVSTSFISPQRSTTSPVRSNVSFQSPILEESESSSDSVSEPGLIIDEDAGDDNNIENDNSLETTTRWICGPAKATSLTNTNRRTFDEDNEQPMPMKKLVKKNWTPVINRKHVSSKKYNELVQERNRLLKQINKYESTWMPTPTDYNTIKYLVETGRLLAGENTGNKMDKQGNKFEDYCKILKMEEDEVKECTSTETITKTCRSLVAKLVPKHQRVHKSWSKVPFCQQQAIFHLARMFHPLEKKSNGELKKACRNVFEVAKCSSRKQGQSIESSDDDADSVDDN